MFQELRLAAPRDIAGWQGGGMLALTTGRIADAVALLRHALSLQPRATGVALALGVAQLAAGDLAQADATLAQLAAREPKLAEAWHHLALVRKARGEFGPAISAHRSAVALKPGFAAGWQALGATLSMTNQQTEAMTCFTRALTLEPANLRARLGRAMILYKSHRVAEAAAEFAAVTQSDPRQFEAQSYRLMALNCLPDLSREEVFAAHVAFGHEAARGVGSVAAVAGQASPMATFEPERRLRVAFLSPDLRSHSVAFFLEPLLQHLDRSAFEIALYHDHPSSDPTTARLRAHADLWRNFAGQADGSVESAIRQDAPDILIDLAGHTGLNRLPLLARRLAPVQISYLGYPNTTGLAAMDYRFVDALTDPEPDAERFHTEKLIRFAPTAWTYSAPADAPVPSAPPCIANGHVTFGSFNNFTKATDATLRLWAEILNAVPRSRLLLKAGGLTEPIVRENVLARLKAAGLDEARVELLGRTADTAAHLALYGRVDVALDMFPYHGTTTTCEALWMGVPVVTLAGDRHASRVGVSLLTAIGRPDWIASSPADYVRIAAELAQAPETLQQNRISLREAILRSPLGDHAGQAACFGAALRSCWRAACERTALPIAS